WIPAWNDSADRLHSNAFLQRADDVLTWEWQCRTVDKAVPCLYKCGTVPGLRHGAILAFDQNPLSSYHTKHP
ncbi:MAG TPA: hypothetical protein VFI14_06350, partial [Chryseosolibacter sp.]|nr:hypothetical protein [Chryseosolibacter sp.]